MRRAARKWGVRVRAEKAERKSLPSRDIMERVPSDRVAGLAASLSFEQLATFQAIAQLGSFTRAAEALSMTQPAVSQRVKRLEAMFGVTIFERAKRNEMRLTPAGHCLLRFADEERALLDRLVLEMDVLKRTAGPQLTVATGPATARYLLPPILQLFTAAYPESRVTLKQCSVAEITQLVTSGEAELGVLDDALVDRRFISYPLFKDRAVLIAASSDPRWGSSPAELAQLPFAATPPGTNMRRIAEEWAASYGAKLHIVLETNLLDSIKEYVLSGRCVAVTSERSVAEELRARTLVALATGNLPRPRGVSLISDARRSLSPEADAFIQVVSASVPHD